MRCRRQFPINIPKKNARFELRIVSAPERRESAPGRKIPKNSTEKDLFDNII